MDAPELDLSSLSGQRWFGGKDRPLERVLDAGSIELRGGALRLARAVYADTNGWETYLLLDPAIDWPATLIALVDGPVDGSAGELRLRFGPHVGGRVLPLGGPGRTSIPSLDQSNSLFTIDQALMVKLYRRPLPGIHPEVEIGEALAGTDAPVARHHGALELVGADGVPIVVGCLQQFIPGAQGGWEWPIAIAMADLETGIPAASTLTLARTAGQTLARLHGALAAALGVTVGSGDQQSGSAARSDGEAHEYEAAITALRDLSALEDDSAIARGQVGTRLDALLRTSGQRQRIHGDLHIAQLLRTCERITVIDFEGNPTLDLAARRIPMSPLRDLATLRRSFDHVVTAAARRVGPPPERTLAWSDQVLEEIAVGYGLRRADGAVHASDASLLHAFEVAAELRELRYARSVLPEWAYVAHAGLARLAADPPQ